MNKISLEDKPNLKYAVPNWLRDEQIRYAISKVKDRVIPNENRIEDPIAIVGYGPSLKYNWEKIKDFKYVMTCSGAHKFLIQKGIIPNYHVEVDPRKHKVELLGEPNKKTEYLIASTCNPEYFNHLEGHNVKLWHIFDSTDEGIAMLPPGEWAVTGGCDAGLRCFTMAAFLGYRNFHVFGIDGCAEGEHRHADYHPNGKQKYAELEYNDKVYYTTPAMLEASKQTMHELDMMPAVKVTFYGEGLTQEMYNNHIPEIKEENSQFENVIAFQKPELITPEYADLNKKLHEQNAAYGVGGGKHAEVVLKICESLNSKLVLDYGCGKGYLGKALPFPIWEYDPGVVGKEDSPRPADLVVCTDVLEHIEPELISDVLGDLKRCVRQVGYFVIHTGPASKTLPDGRNTHLIQQGIGWWSSVLEQFFTIGSIKQKGPELHVVVGPKIKFINKVKKNKIYIGWDCREVLAYNVAKHSLENKSANPENLDIKSLKLEEISNILKRPIEWRGQQMWCPISDAPQTTEFSISRFAIPFLEKGWVLFVDCDIVAVGDINDLFKQADPKYAVMVVKHQQKVKDNEIKMINQASVYYERKNWSSVMLINCDHPSHKNLSLEDLNSWPGRDLHAFKWLKDEEIGELGNEWNYLVDVNNKIPKEDAKVLHYTLGGPWMGGWYPKDSDKEWHDAYSNFKKV